MLNELIGSAPPSVFYLVQICSKAHYPDVDFLLGRGYLVEDINNWHWTNIPCRRHSAKKQSDGLAHAVSIRISITSADADKEVVERGGGSLGSSLGKLSTNDLGHFSWVTLWETSWKTLAISYLRKPRLESYLRSLGNSLAKLSWKAILEISLNSLLQLYLGKCSWVTLSEKPPRKVSWKTRLKHSLSGTLLGTYYGKHSRGPSWSTLAASSLENLSWKTLLNNELENSLGNLFWGTLLNNNLAESLESLAKLSRSGKFLAWSTDLKNSLGTLSLTYVLENSLGNMAWNTLWENHENPKDEISRGRKLKMKGGNGFLLPR